MFTVMGATGQTGSETVAGLLSAGARVRVVSRSPQRAAALWGNDVEICEADPQDAAALARAFAGAGAAYVMLPMYTHSADCIAESRRASAAIAKAARASRVERLVALSSGGAHLESGSGIVRTLHDFEEELRSTGLPLTLIRASDFIENWGSALDVARTAGVLPSGRVPLNRGMQTVSVKDVGAMAAECLLSDREVGRIVNLLGPVDYSPEDVSGALSELFGRPVVAVPASKAEIEEGLASVGCSRSYVENVLELYDALNGGLSFEAGVGETVRGSTTLIEALENLIRRSPSETELSADVSATAKERSGA